MIIPEVYRCHLEEFQALWEHRQELLRAPDLIHGDLGDWTSRIRAHLDGLLAPGEEAVSILTSALEDGDIEIEFAAAYALLRLNSAEAANVVIEAFLKAEAEDLEKLGRALCCGPIGRLEKQLVETLETAHAALAVAAAEVLAVHGRLDPESPSLVRFFQDDDAAVRQVAWRIAALLDARRVA